MEESDAEFATYFRSKTLQYHTRIEHAISDALARFSESKFYDPLNYAISDGKRIRPLIVLLIHDALAINENMTSDPIPAAVAVELLHLESIIHDDIIDEESVRRDRTVFHKKYGLSTSILSADFVLGIILEIASQYADTRIGRELSKAAILMSEGEIEELLVKSRAEIGVEEYTSIVSHKTASLFQASARIGAIISGAKQQSIESMADFGLNLGIAYQIQDDLLDWNESHGLARRVRVPQLSLQKSSYEFARTAMNSLVHLSDSEAKTRLIELAQFAVRRRF
jgi:octaprenyl-diphosphate synthase